MSRSLHTKRLHTDHLEAKYGKISANVVMHNDTMRKVNLIDKDGISRTFSLVFFYNHKNKLFKKINDKLKNDGLIGKTFREHGYIIYKNILLTGTIKLPEWLRHNFKTQSNYASTKAYVLCVQKKPFKPVKYGTVVEIYAPDFLQPSSNSVNFLKTNNEYNSSLANNMIRKILSHINAPIYDIILKKPS